MTLSVFNWLSSSHLIQGHAKDWRRRFPADLLRFRTQYNLPSLHCTDRVRLDFDWEILIAGDRWLVQCLGCLYSSKGLFYRVVPADQGFHTGDDYAGIFR